MVRKLSDHGSSRKRNVDSEETRLWEKMIGDVKPLNGEHRRVAPKVMPVNPRRSVTRDNGARAGYGSGSDMDALASTQSRVSPSRQSPVKHVEGAQPHVLDRKNLRRIGKGRISIDDRIDLHGMRQGEAYTALLQFLRRGQVAQFKTVLVITGKGKFKSERSENWMDDRDVGVLRREVPNWLKSDELEDVVLGFSNALPQHGGNGALYVRLRRGR